MTDLDIHTTCKGVNEHGMQEYVMTITLRPTLEYDVDVLNLCNMEFMTSAFLYYDGKVIKNWYPKPVSLSINLLHHSEIGKDVVIPTSKVSENFVLIINYERPQTNKGYIGYVFTGVTLGKCESTDCVEFPYIDNELVTESEYETKIKGNVNHDPTKDIKLDNGKILVTLTNTMYCKNGIVYTEYIRTI